VRALAGGSKDTRERILACAASLFGKQGYEAVAVSDIAEACGVSTGLIYYHYKDKESLLAALAERIREELVEPALAVLGGQGSPRARLERFVEAWVVTACEDPGVIRIYIRALTDPEGPHAAERLEAASRTVEALAAVIAEGVEAGSFRVTDPMLAAECLFGLVSTRATAGALGAPHDQLVAADARQTARFISDLFMEGISAC
jgi:AcrR family transcriptional regulator